MLKIKSMRYEHFVIKKHIPSYWKKEEVLLDDGGEMEIYTLAISVQYKVYTFVYIYSFSELNSV